ncbi:hypothetical protein G7046_g8048 [Stylonectria norvegica]|nr:hypothetical protein G7046_g8048 [Stylonectria norvegica]
MPHTEGTVLVESAGPRTPQHPAGVTDPSAVVDGAIAALNGRKGLPSSTAEEKPLSPGFEVHLDKDLSESQSSSPDRPLSPSQTVPLPQSQPLSPLRPLDPPVWSPIDRPWRKPRRVEPPSFNMNPGNFSGSFPHGGNFAPAGMPPVLPSVTEVGSFDGNSSSASRWLARLEWSFRTSNCGIPVPPGVHLNAINIFVEGPAATFLDSSERLRSIVERGQLDENSITPADLGVVVTALREKEPLAAYFGRALTALRRVGGRDSQATGGIPLTDLELYSLRQFVSNFVTGLYDHELRQEAVNQSALSSTGLRAAYQTVQRSVEILKAREKIAKDRAAAERTVMLEQLLERETGRQADQMIAETYGQPYGAYGLHSGRVTPAPMDQRYAALPPPGMRFETQTQEPKAPNYRKDPSESAPKVVAPVAPPQAPPVARPPPPARLEGRTMNPRQVLATEEDRKASKNPFVSGKEPLPPNKLICVNCGKVGHKSPACTSPSLSAWERAVLRQMVFPPSTPRDPVGGWRRPGSGGVGMNSAQLTGDGLSTDWDSDEDDVGDCIREMEELVTEGTIGARNVTLTPAIGLFDEVSSALEHHGAVAARLGQLLAEEGPEPVDMEALAESTLMVMALSSDLEPAPKKRKGASMAILSILNGEDDKGESDCPRWHKSATLPGMTEEEVEKAARRTTRKIKNGISSLSEIWAREGLGPVNWIEIASRVMVLLNLIELWQISPEGAKQMRHLSSRKTEPRKKSKSKKAHGVVGAQLSSVGRAANPDYANTLRLTYGACQRTYRVDITVEYGSRFDCQFDFPAASLVSELGIPVMSLASIGFKGLEMLCADGRRTPVSHFVRLQVTCSGIRREQWALVRLKEKDHFDDTPLILGMPWLHDVGAVFDIWRGTLEIGDHSRGEKRSVVKGLSKIREKTQLLVLGPAQKGTAKKSLRRMEPSQLSDDTESSDESSEESSSEDEEDTDSTTSEN